MGRQVDYLENTIYIVCIIAKLKLQAFDVISFLHFRVNAALKFLSKYVSVFFHNKHSFIVTLFSV